MTKVIRSGKRKTIYEELQSEVLRKKLQKAKDKIHSLEDVQSVACKKSVSYEEWLFIETNFSSDVSLLKNEYANSNKSKFVLRYSENIVSFSNALHYYSCKAYKYLASLFTLSSPTKL